jgi:hypothetical protein
MLASFYIYTYQTTFAEGFLQTELDDLLKCFPEILDEDYLDALFEYPCILVNQKLLMRKEDVESAIFHCMKELI